RSSGRKLCGSLPSSASPRKAWRSRSSASTPRSTSCSRKSVATWSRRARPMRTSHDARTALARLRQQYDQGIGARRVLEERLDAVEARRDELQRQLVQWDLERILLGKVSDMARSRVKAHVEATVTAALQAVLGRPMRFEVRLRDLGGQPAADWLVVSQDGGEEIVTDPEDGRGGGVLDIVSLALRM